LVSGGDESEAKSKKDLSTLGIVCRNCGKTGDHWTLKCPYFNASGGTPLPSSNISSDVEKSAAAIGGGGDGKYVPPSRRGGGGPPSSSPSSSSSSTGGSEAPRRDESSTIRVTNLSEDTKESDLQELFHRFGPISRIYLAKDKNTLLSKGFAFINFVYREDAAKAIEKLSGKFGYDHLILRLEWAKPSNK